MDVRHEVGAREICRALGTGERRLAVPMALQLGAAATSLFHHLRDPMSNPPDPLMIATLRLAKVSVRRMIERDEAEERLAEEQAQGRDKVARMLREQSVLIAQMQREHEQALKLQAATVERDAFKSALESLQPHPKGQAQGSPAPTESIAPAPVVLILDQVIDSYIDSYPKAKKAAMFKKMTPAIALLRELHGRKQVRDLKRIHIRDYFDVVHGLPPRWRDKCKARKISARQLAEEEHPELLAAKSFDDNYLAVIKLFLKWAKAEKGDEGFPDRVSADAIEFEGEDDRGDKRQRALRADELSRLFHGPELQACKLDGARAHMWWLPVVAFYTGARVNELAQLNPQVDVQQDAESGIDYLVIDEKTAADPRIKKSVKTGEARLVPLHPELRAAGFLEYVQGVRDAGHQLMFPAWKPINKRASVQAERWFRDLLRDTGLRDETPGQCVLGMHTFRHTLLTLAANSEPPVDAGSITGHADQTKGAPQRGYETKFLPAKLTTLKAIQFGFKP